MVTQPATPGVFFRISPIRSDIFSVLGWAAASGSRANSTAKPWSSVGKKTGRLAGEFPAGQQDDRSIDDHHQAGPLDHPADDPHVEILGGLEDLVEPPVKPVGGFRPGLEPQGALGRLQGQGIDGADDGSGGDDQGELAEDLAGDAGQESRREKDRDQGQGDAHDGADQLAHGLHGRMLGRQAFFDVIGAAFHDDDGIVDHDADGQDQGEHGHEVDGEAQGQHGDKGADDRHRDGRGRDEQGPEVLQKEHDHQEDQDTRFEEGFVHMGHGLPDEFGGVEADEIFQAVREIPAHVFQGPVDLVGHGDGVGLGQGEHDDLGGAGPAHIGKVGIRLLA